MFAALPVVVAALTSFAHPVVGSPAPAMATAIVPSSPTAVRGAGVDEADAAVIAAEALAGAERVVAVHELAGAVAFDLIEDGQRWQLTVALDDDGLVVDTALGRIGGAATMTPGAQPIAPIRIARLDRIDRDARGRLVLREGAHGRRVVVRPV